MWASFALFLALEGVTFDDRNHFLCFNSSFENFFDSLEYKYHQHIKKLEKLVQPFLCNINFKSMITALLFLEFDNRKINAMFVFVLLKVEEVRWSNLCTWNMFWYYTIQHCKTLNSSPPWIDYTNCYANFKTFNWWFLPFWINGKLKLIYLIQIIL